MLIWCCTTCCLVWVPLAAPRRRHVDPATSSAQGTAARPARAVSPLPPVPRVLGRAAALEVLRRGDGVLEALDDLAVRAAVEEGRPDEGVVELGQLDDDVAPVEALDDLEEPGERRRSEGARATARADGSAGRRGRASRSRPRRPRGGGARRRAPGRREGAASNARRSAARFGRTGDGLAASTRGWVRSNARPRKTRVAARARAGAPPIVTESARVPTVTDLGGVGDSTSLQCESARAFRKKTSTRRDRSAG